MVTGRGVGVALTLTADLRKPVCITTHGDEIDRKVNAFCQRKDSRERDMKYIKSLLVITFVAITMTACSKDSDQVESNAQSTAWKRGRAVYVANCTACHNNDPSKDGPIGPANKGSSKELLEARVLSTSYPPGYKPKRPTRIMPQFPFLKEEIPYLAEYLK
jgi:mono/diheme cytochrome c family protein